MSNTYLLEMDHIQKSFGKVKALSDGCLKVRPGTVHALMGENGAGKSTLMKCLFGIYHKDGGTIYLDGNEVNFQNPADALAHKVSMVHQELNQVPFQSVMENVWLGRYPLKKNGLIDEKAMETETSKIFKRLDIDIDPKAKIRNLQVAQKQMVEIAKAISYDSKILVLDEPTSSLTENEVQHLFDIIRKLIEQGIGIIFITHKMDEVRQISDDVTVMRDGTWISTKPTSEITDKQIIGMMVGREMNDLYPPKTRKVQDEVILEVENLGTKRPAFKDVSFKLHRGEILGISGLVGSKRTEILETLFGSREKGEGKIIYKGKNIEINSEPEAIRNGFAMVTEERRANGIFAGLSVSFNMLISNLSKYTKHGILDKNDEQADIDKMIKSLAIKVDNSNQPISNLSGGNQQKVIIARWLLTNPEILLLDEPTRGIDVGAKYEIYKLMDQIAAEGKSIIMVSSELPELLGVCDRILVMSEGREAGIFNASETSQVELMTAASKYV